MQTMSRISRRMMSFIITKSPQNHLIRTACSIVCFTHEHTHGNVSETTTGLKFLVPLQNRFLFSAPLVFSLEHSVSFSGKNYSSWIWISKNGLYVYSESSILFWDLENIAIPIGTSFHRRVKCIRIALGYYGIQSTPSIYMYGKSFMTRTISNDFANLKGVQFVSSQPGPNQADNDLIEGIRVWLLSNPPPTVVVLLGGDGIYVQIVKELQLKGHVVVLMSPNTRSTNLELKQIVDIFIPWDSVLERTVVSRFDPLVAKDSKGNEIIEEELLKTLGLGNRTLVLGLKGHPTYIAVENEGTIAEFAIDAMCTRHKAVVDYYPAENMFKCSFCGSQYDHQGSVVNGPAILSLPLVSCEKHHGKVMLVPWRDIDFRSGAAPWWSP